MERAREIMSLYLPHSDWQHVQRAIFINVTFKYNYSRLLGVATLSSPSEITVHYSHHLKIDKLLYELAFILVNEVRIWDYVMPLLSEHYV